MKNVLPSPVTVAVAIATPVFRSARVGRSTVGREVSFASRQLCVPLG